MRTPLFLSMAVFSVAVFSFVHSSLVKAGGEKKKAADERKPYVETVERDGRKVSFEMVPIPGGTFQMGSADNENGRSKDEGPLHAASVNPFWMARCETTWGMYDLWWEKLPNESAPKTEADKKADAISRPSKANFHDIDWGFGRAKDQPLVAVSHHAAMEFCRWLSAKTGKHYRLPTEVEWEWACRGGSKSAYSFGEDSLKLGEFAWFEKNSDDMPHPVAKKKPNAYGLHDMHGNVAEWCIDLYAADAYVKRPTGMALKLPFNPPINKRFGYVTRGGSWLDPAEKCRSASRTFSVPDWQKKDPQLPQSIWWNNADWVGFRVVCTDNDPESLRNLRSKVTKESPN